MEKNKKKTLFGWWWHLLGIWNSTCALLWNTSGVLLSHYQLRYPFLRKILRQHASCGVFSFEALLDNNPFQSPHILIILWRRKFKLDTFDCHWYLQIRKSHKYWSVSFMCILEFYWLVGIAIPLEKIHVIIIFFYLILSQVREKIEGVLFKGFS